MFKEPDAKEYIAKAIKINKAKEDKKNAQLGCAILCIPIIIIFFIVIDQLGGGPQNRLKQRKQNLISLVNRIERDVNFSHSGWYKDAFNLFGTDLYSDNKILMKRLLRVIIRTDFIANDSHHCFRENNPGRYYSGWLRRDWINKNSTLRNQLLADKEYWEAVSVQLCNEEYYRNGGW